MTTKRTTKRENEQIAARIEIARGQQSSELHNVKTERDLLRALNAELLKANQELRYTIEDLKGKLYAAIIALAKAMEQGTCPT